MAILKTAAAALAFLTVTVPAGAAVITFNGLAGTNMAGNVGFSSAGYTNFFRTTATVDGFKFQGANDNLIITSTYSSNTDTNTANRAYNGTDFLMTTDLLTISKQVAAPFSVQSLDLKDWASNVQTAVVTGYFSNGGSISKSLNINTTPNKDIALGNDFTKYFLTGFTGLSSFTIRGNTGSWLAVDNVAVNGTTVPEPGTLAVFGLGLAGLAALRRRKQK